MLDFPASPTDGQQYPAPNGVTYQWQAVPGMWITALEEFAPLDSPVFEGDPQAPTPAAADDDTSIATTAFVKDQGYAVDTDLDNYLLLAGGTLTGQLASTTSLTGASTPALNIQQTWDNAAAGFTASSINVTDTASTGASYLAIWSVGGAGRFTVSKAGGLTIANSMTIGAGNYYAWTGRCLITCPVDGQIRLTNNAQTDFSRLMLGGTTASFPAIKRNLTALNFRLADDSADAPITAGSVTAMAGTTVAAGANTQAFIKASSTANLGLYYGSGAPAFSAAKGSLYTNTTATTTTTRLYVNTDGGTTWANFTASA